MKVRGLSLLRVGGIQIIIDYSWFVIFFLVIYSMTEVYFLQTQGRYSTPEYWIMGLAAATLLFVSVLVHELAHSFVALRHGVEVVSIRLFIFGGVAQIASEPKSGRHEFLIALAGPVASMILACFFGGIYYLFSLLWSPSSALGVIAGCLALANAGLALFNMIPGFPLDGGRILRAILWDRWNDTGRATKVVSQIGNAFALFLILVGVLQFFFVQSIVSGLWLIFIGLFMKQSAIGNYQAVIVREALAGVKVSEIMTENVVSVDWLTSVEDLVREYIYRYQFTHFPVFNRDELLGMVSLAQVKDVSKELWSFKQVRAIMTS